MKNDTIKSLWIGNHLSPNEVLCINSYLQNNHPFELYVYDHLKNVPSGVTIKEAAEIIPATEVFTIKSGFHKGSLSAFSNIFRYKLLYELGGWWSDMDAICVKPFEFEDKYVFMSHHKSKNNITVANGIIKCEKKSQIMKYCYEKALDMVNEIINLEWGASGPGLLITAIQEYQLMSYVKPPIYFAPIGWNETMKFFSPYIIDQNTFSIHLYNESWRKDGFSKYCIYPRNSLYEQLKRKYHVKSTLSGFFYDLIQEFRVSGMIDGFIKTLKRFYRLCYAYLTIIHN